MFLYKWFIFDIRTLNAVAIEVCQVLIVPWTVLESYEKEQQEAETGNVADFLSKLPLFRYIVPSQLRVLAMLVHN